MIHDVWNHWRFAVAKMAKGHVAASFTGEPRRWGLLKARWQTQGISRSLNGNVRVCCMLLCSTISIHIPCEVYPYPYKVSGGAYSKKVKERTTFNERLLNWWCTRGHLSLHVLLSRTLPDIGLSTSPARRSSWMFFFKWLKPAKH